ncbi:MAG: TM1802 family CRISPR-associated protein, partial [Candidatus Hodarchaeales archaeon]
FNMGFFTLDHSGFGLNFPKKKEQTVLRICEECDLKLRSGLNVLESTLRFYAYQIGEGSNQQSVYHYLIPLVHDEKMLSMVLDRIARAKHKIIEEKLHDVDENIKRIQIMMKNVDRKKQQQLKKELSELKSSAKKIEQNKQNIELIELLLEIGKEEGVAFFDLYFKETDRKQNPTVKEIVGAYHIRKKRFEKIVRVFNETLEIFTGYNLRIWHLKSLIGDRTYPQYLQAIFEETKIKRDIFLKRANDVIRQAFLSKVMNYGSEYFSNLIITFRVFYTIFEKLDVYR